MDLPPLRKRWTALALACVATIVTACSAAPSSDPSSIPNADASSACTGVACAPAEAGAPQPPDSSAPDSSAPDASTHNPDSGTIQACDPIDTHKPLPPATGMYVETFAGPVTKNEVDSFKSTIFTLTPAPDNIGNTWAQHQSGSDTKSMGILYAITHDVSILARMLVFCDAVLSERNDLAPAPVGQHVIWTGRIDPVWPNNTSTPLLTMGEQGDPIGHLGHCARLVLETPSLWSLVVPDGNPKGYGATYLERAKRYVKEADFAIDGHVLKSLLDVSTQDRQKWAAALPTLGGGEVPWNQQMMFDYAFQNLSSAHAILGDDPARVARYDSLVQATMDWFFHGGGTPKTDGKGNPIYFWGYQPTALTEDNSHGDLDVAGFFRAYVTGHYGVTAPLMIPFANTFLDVMRRSPTDYAGRVDGTDGAGNSAPTTYARPDYILLAEFRPADYTSLVTGARLQEGATTGSIDAFSRFAWMKTRRCLAGIH
jgi:hypothetical protein